MEADLATAEVFIDAFYSFDPVERQPLLAGADESSQSIMYYQGWAESDEHPL